MSISIMYSFPFFSRTVSMKSLLARLGPFYGAQGSIQIKVTFTFLLFWSIQLFFFVVDFQVKLFGISWKHISQLNGGFI